MSEQDDLTLNRSLMEDLGARLERDMAGVAALGLIYLGDRLGLFTALRDGGPATAAELAARTGLVERYVREWLAGMAAARYLAYDARTQRFSLTAEQAAYLADPDSASFTAPTAQYVLKILEQADAVATAFRHGGGVPYSAYDAGVTEGFERSARATFRNSLVQTWLPALPGVVEALEAGGSMLDVGCGGGGACLAVAQAFPHAHIMGIDAHPPAIERAQAAAAASGLADRVSFTVLRAEDLPDGPAYDLVTTFDVVHDLADPVGALRGIRRVLKPDGAYLMMDPNAADTLEGNLSAQGQFFYWASVYYCLTVSLAQGGVGLGTCMGEARARELAAEGGFSSFRRLPIEDGWNAFFDLRP
jgi:2-polyprenyl-3-methyl-5-hydroxy-6-metoxy-1,4-benzoquinol methylase